MAQVAGIIKVYVNNALYRTLEGAKLMMGGDKREMVSGHAVYGHKVTAVMPGGVETKIVHTSDVDLDEIRSIANATIRYECDNGSVYTIADATLTEVIEMENGEISLKFEGQPAIAE